MEGGRGAFGGPERASLRSGESVYGVCVCGGGEGGALSGRADVGQL